MGIRVLLLVLLCSKVRARGMMVGRGGVGGGDRRDEKGGE